jgi:hypothetical protein
MEQGYIKIFRSIIKWEWYSDVTTSRLYMHILLKANFASKVWQGETVDIGELITSLNNLSFETNLTKQQVRTSLKKLESTGEITILSTTKYTKIIVNNYKSYQSKKNNKEVTHGLTHTLTHKTTQTSTQQLTQQSTQQNSDIYAQNKEKLKNINTVNNTVNNTDNNTQTNTQITHNLTLTKEYKNIKNIYNINNINIIVKKWNDFSIIYNLSSVKKITDKRKKSILERAKEKEFNFDAILEEIQQSDFLLGKNSDWKISFDFIFLSKNNYIKILEGNYKNKHTNLNLKSKARELYDAI